MRLILSIYLSMFIVVLCAQSRVSGYIYLDDGTPAIGATIQLLNSDYAAITEIDGFFELSDVKAGTYQVNALYIGMKEVTRNLTVQSGKNYTLTINLEADANILDDIVVTAKNESTKQKEQAIKIESIELTQVVSQVKDLNEVVDQLPGVRVRTSGSLGDRADINLNGLTGTAIRTFIDGMPLEFIFPSGSLSNIPLTNVNRIDVYKGVVPINVGTDAMGGGINVVTEYKPYNSLKASYSYGSFNTHQANIAGNYAINDHIIATVNATYNKSDNDYKMNIFVHDTEFTGEVKETKRFHDAYDFKSVQVGLVFKDLQWTDRTVVSGNYIDFYKEIQNGGIINRIATGEAFFEGTNKNISLDYRKKINKLSIESKFALGKETTMYIDTTRNRYSWSGEVLTTSKKGELGVATNSERNSKVLLNRTNVEYQVFKNTFITASNIFGRMSINGRDRVITDPKDDVLFKPQTLQKNVTGLEIRQKLFDKLDITTAIKHYRYNLDFFDINSKEPLQQNDNINGWYLTGKYDINDNLFIRASFENAYRIPTLVQFFGNGRQIQSNPILKPESSNNYNLGASYNTKKANNLDFSIAVNGFIRQQKDIIFLTGGMLQQYLNSEKVNSQGIEVDMNLGFLDHFNLNINGTKLSKTYGILSRSRGTSQFLEGTDFPNTPSTFWNAKLSYQTDNLIKAKDGFRTYIQYKNVDEFNFLNVSEIRNDENWVPRQQRLDAGFTYSIENNRLSISANAYNILNRELFDNFKIPRPGRSYNVKFIYQIY